jgi:membrane-associated phospholipid phosphatase
VTAVADLQPADASEGTLLGLAHRVGVPMAAGIGVGTVVSVVVGLVLVTGGGVIDGVDRVVVDLLVAERTDGLDRLTAVAVLPADSSVIAIVWAGSVLATLRWTSGWTAPGFLVFVVGGDTLTYLATSVAVGRPRPPVESLGHSFTTSSFPSGHVGAALSLYGAIAVAYAWHRAVAGRPLPRRALALLGLAVVAVTALVGFSRLYSAQHYPSDAVWGVVLGVAWLAAGVGFVLRPGSAVARQGRPVGWASRRGRVAGAPMLELRRPVVHAVPPPEARARRRQRAARASQE